MNQYITRFVDPYHDSIKTVQCHFGIVVEMKSSVRAVMVNRQGAQRVYKNVKVYPAMGVYDNAIFKAEGVRPTYQVKHICQMNNAGYDIC